MEAEDPKLLPTSVEKDILVTGERPGDRGGTGSWWLGQA